jgi:hypothetical protein
VRRGTLSGVAGAVSNLAIVAVAVCAVIALSTWAGADSTARRQARDTHVGVAPADLVVLQFVGPVADSNNSSAPQKFVRVHPDGTKDTTEFAVPSGHRLVVTDVNWAPAQALTTQYGGHSMLRIWIENKTSTSTRAPVYLASQTQHVPASSAVTGFSVSNGGRLVADVYTQGDTDSSTYMLRGNPATNGAPYTSLSILLRGYVVREN